MPSAQDPIERMADLASEFLSLAGLVRETRQKAEALKPSLPTFDEDVPVPGALIRQMMPTEGASR